MRIKKKTYKMMKKTMKGKQKERNLTKTRGREGERNRKRKTKKYWHKKSQNLLNVKMLRGECECKGR